MKRYLILAIVLLTVNAEAQVSHTCPNGQASRVGPCDDTSDRPSRDNNEQNRPSEATIRHRQVVALVNQAADQIAAGDCQTAKTTLYQAMKLDWYDGMAHYNYSVCLEKEGSYAGAIEEAQKALQYGGDVNKKHAKQMIAYAQWAIQKQAADAAAAEQERKRQAAAAEAARQAEIEEERQQEKAQADANLAANVNSLVDSLHAVQSGNMSEEIPLAAPESGSKSGSSEKRVYIPSGNGLIGGTKWIVGYNAPPNASPAVVAQEKKMLAQQIKLAGIPFDESVDFSRYNFVLGVAASTDTVTDLRKRVLFDQLLNGKATPVLQAAYSSIKDHAFDELACHSNGAMICLAALENEDVQADRVVLYGPQITLESVQMWQGLIDSHRVKSVQIYINQNDPVPPLTMAFGGGSMRHLVSSLPLLNLNIMSDVLREAAPSIGVKTFPCDGSVLTAACHDLRVYKEDGVKNP